MELRYRIVDTAAGFVAIVASDAGLRRVFLPRATRAAVEREVRREFPSSQPDDDLLPSLVQDLERYFAGDPVEFSVRFDWRGHSQFEVDVWRACARLRYGETSSYGGLADTLGRPGGARAVGTAMSHNPYPIVVPCHRVLRSDGSLGGYSGPGGIDFKRRLLDMESAGAPAR